VIADQYRCKKHGAAFKPLSAAGGAAPLSVSVGSGEAGAVLLKPGDTQSGQALRLERALPSDELLLGELMAPVKRPKTENADRWISWPADAAAGWSRR
jgi:hypothetical protein